MGPAADGGADLRPLPAGPGSSDPGAADGRAAACVSTHHALPVLGAATGRPGPGRRPAAAPAARADLRRGDRAVGLLRTAHQRGLPPGLRRRRPGRGCADRAGVEVRQVPDRARALHHPRRAADLRRPPRPALPGPGVGGVLPQQPGPAAGRPQRLAHLRRDTPDGRDHRPARGTSAQDSRPAPQLHRRHPAGLVPRRR